MVNELSILLAEKDKIIIENKNMLSEKERILDEQQINLGIYMRFVS
jgi:hypothetical protein